jgi:Ni,Fe-hydrogenase I cytochrome b subunit
VGDLIATGRVADLIVGIMWLELVVLTLVYRRTGRGVPPPELAASLAAGMALVYALRAALARSSWQHIAMWLILALAAHVLYLVLRSGSHKIS